MTFFFFTTRHDLNRNNMVQFNQYIMSRQIYQLQNSMIASTYQDDHFIFKGGGEIFLLNYRGVARAEKTIVLPKYNENQYLVYITLNARHNCVHNRKMFMKDKVAENDHAQPRKMKSNVKKNRLFVQIS